MCFILLVFLIPLNCTNLMDLDWSKDRAQGCPYVVKYHSKFENCSDYHFRHFHYFGFDRSKKIFDNPINYCYRFDAVLGWMSFDKKFKAINNTHLRWISCDGCKLYNEYECVIHHGLIEIDKCYTITKHGNPMYDVYYAKYSVEFGCLHPP